MKLQIVSDLHLEFAPVTLPVTDADVIIMAGDVGTYQLVAPFIERTIEEHQKPVVFIPGNHEYYYADIAFINELWKDKEWYCHKKVTVINGVRIASCTLWTDFWGRDIRSMRAAAWGMNDFQCIKFGGVPWSPELCAYESDKQGRWLSELSGKVDVVVTHHAPSRKSVHRNYLNDPINAAFCNEYDALVEAVNPKLWVHGHTHHSWDYMIGTTRVVCNPRGYVYSSGQKERPYWDGGLVIEI